MRRAALLSLAIAVPLGMSASTASRPGSLDPSFGKGGIVRTAVGEDSSAGAVAVQADGKLVAVGGSDYAFAVVRYNRNGSLDRSFGLDGIVTTEIGRYNAFASSVAVQNDGKIVAAGSTTWLVGEHDYDAQHRFALVRYLPNGSIDRSFGSRGIVITAVGAPDDSYVNGLVVRTDGKLVAAGYSLGSAGTSDFALVRYRADGIPDPAFGKGGIVTTVVSKPAVDNGAEALATQADGKLVVAGAESTFGRFVVLRYRSNGSLDRSFGSDGQVTTPTGTGDAAPIALAVGARGSLLVAGGDNRGFVLVRYTSKGKLDRAFGSNGLSRTPMIADDCCFDAGGFAIQLDGKPVVVGAAEDTYSVARYSPNGKLDRGFGSRGKVRTRLAEGSVGGLAIQRDGKLVVAGASAMRSRDVLTLVRYFP